MVNKFFYIIILLGIFLYNIPLIAQSFYTAWENRYTLPAGGNNFAQTITIDASGNTIISSGVKKNINDITEFKFLTIKYDAPGNQLWAVESASYESTTNVRALKTDASGNIYVAGDYSPGIDFDYNAIVMKYNPAGVQQWVYVYDGNSGNDTTYDLASSIDIDANGNIYLTGKSLVAGSWNMFTIKINSSGTFVWKNLILTNSAQRESSITIDNTLNRIYAASHGAIVCYDANGTEFWRSVSGLKPKIMLHEGNLFLGSSFTHAINIFKINPLTGDTIWTVSRSATGPERKYCIDKAGNLFASGWTNVDSLTAKWITLKYNPAGVLQWEKNFLAGNRLLCAIGDIGTDDSLNAYIAGTTLIEPPPFFNGVKRLTSLVYDKNGNLLQENNYIPSMNSTSYYIAEFIPLAVNKTGSDYYVFAREKVSTVNPVPLNFVTINYRSTALLPAPTSLTAEAVSSGRINLNWKYSSPAPAGFIIERSFDDCSEYFYHDSIPGNVTSFADTIVGPGTFYCYRVYAYTDSTRSAYSNVSSDTTHKPVGITINSNIIPTEYSLYQNYPNPFNPVTNISFDLSKSGKVTLKIYDVLGKEVALLVSGFHQAGKYSLSWNAEQFSSGIYFYKIESGNFIQIKRMVLIK